jgi:hypothetical protein
MTGLVGCCGRFHISANGTWFDEWSEKAHPLRNWDFTHDLGITMHFVFTVDQQALLRRTALSAIPQAVRAAVQANFTGYALDYETGPAGGWSSQAFANETDGLLSFVSQLAASLRNVGKELIVDMGGTTAASLSTQACAMKQPAICSKQKALVERWVHSGATSLMEMGTYYGTDLHFNEMVITTALQHGVPTDLISAGVGSTTSAGCGCGKGSGGDGGPNRSCCAPDACCGPAQSPWAHQPPFGPPACRGSPCGACRSLGTPEACFNWTRASLRSWVATLARHDIRQISLFMPTMDGSDQPGKEGRNATSAFFYDVLGDFLRRSSSRRALQQQVSTC